MVDVADYVNEVKRDKETLQIINDLEVCFCSYNFNKFNNNFIKHSREFIKEFR